MPGSVGSAAPLRVVVCDDHALMRSALCLLLTPEEGLEVVGEAGSGLEVLPLVERTRPDVVVLDLNMPQLDGLTCLERLAEQHPQVRTVVLSGSDDEASVDAALRRGAVSYVLKSVDPVDLPALVRQAVAGCVFQPGMLLAAARQSPSKAAGLSDKECEVLAELAKGHSNRQIAETLWLSEQTVKF
ncbi:MAG TPA: response regulator transcription factor, partial [Gaiellaceae bacterium]|nr:response regulator transcription factor [Gaiellaceae bacterium]